MTFNRNKTVQQLMTKSVVTVRPNDTLVKVKEIFEANDFHHIPVVDEAHQVKGIISRVDFYKIQDSLTIFNTKESKRHNDSIFQSTLVEDIMVQRVVTLKPTDTALIAVGLFRENLFHALPIVDEQGQLLGILTTYDLLTYAYNEPVFVE